LIFPGEKSSREWLVTDHRLHSFSPRYFDGKVDRLFSYSEANAAASRSLSALSNERAPGFFGEPLPDPGEEARRVELLNLIEFFGNPAKYFIRRRLRLNLFEEDDVLEENELFELSPLESYILKEELVNQALANQRVTSDAYAARGVLPLGEMGLGYLQALQSASEAFLEKLEPELVGKKRNEPLPIDMQIGQFRFTGWIESIYGKQIIQYRCAALKGKDRLRAWISHVVHCASNPDASQETVLIGADELMRFAPLEDAPKILGMLLEIYWRGLSRVLPFFPSSALEYARVELSSSGAGRAPSTDKALQRASQIWHGSGWNGDRKGDRKGEKDDSYYAFCFSDRDPLDDEFRALAMEVFEPMLRSAGG
jgi:exodeoxyribonuclease V gamma subunit